MKCYLEHNTKLVFNIAWCTFITSIGEEIWQVFLGYISIVMADRACHSLTFILFPVWQKGLNSGNELQRTAMLKSIKYEHLFI